MAGQPRSRELVVLGTASRAPTRDRNHNGYMLRWDGIGLLFDPGEGTQRQMLHAGVRSSQVTHILISHQHGDHCLGLPGVLQRMAVDQRTRPITIMFPAEAEDYMHRLVDVAALHGQVQIRMLPVSPDGMQIPVDDHHDLHTMPLDHRLPTVGYRLQEHPADRFVPQLLEQRGLVGPIIGELAREGSVVVGGRVITRAEVSRVVGGQSMAFVMDTRPCDGAAELLEGVDLGVVEATFQDGHEELAGQWGHMTASQAGRIAAAAGVRRLLVTHFSQRYPRVDGFAEQAGRHHPDVVAAVDLMRVPVPRRCGTPS